MQYYTFNKDSQNLCNIITAFGKYEYTHLPMSFKCSPDIAQAVMGIDLADVYTCNVGDFSSLWVHHIELHNTFSGISKKMDSLLISLSVNGPSRK